jgi:hypothetical protein
LHPSERPSGTPLDARVATEPREDPAPILCVERLIAGTPAWVRKAKALIW